MSHVYPVRFVLSQFAQLDDCSCRNLGENIFRCNANFLIVYKFYQRFESCFVCFVSFPKSVLTFRENYVELKNKVRFEHEKPFRGCECIGVKNDNGSFNFSVIQIFNRNHCIALELGIYNPFQEQNRCLHHNFQQQFPT